MAEESDLRALEKDYEVRGELRGSDSARYYIGRTRDDRAAEVAIVVVSAPKDGEKNALSHFASDAQILANDDHPALARVLDGRWVGNDAFALVTERILGDPLDELLERGEKFTNPRVAMILQEVNAVLERARERGVVHRGVTPDTLFLEREGDRIRMFFAPTPIPMTGIPDAWGDARTIARLAWAFLTGKPYAAEETRSLGEVCPNLARRVVDAVDQLVKAKDHQEKAPDVGTFLGIVAAGDALKQAEVELAAQKEEYDEQHQRELQKCELQRQETEQHAAEQAAMLAGEREEFRRQMEEQRAALEAERAQFEALMNERKDRFAQVRAELDQQRTELERRLAELEKYQAEVEKVREEALAAREEANRAAREAAKVTAAAALLNDREESQRPDIPTPQQPVYEKVFDKIRIEKAGMDAPKMAKPPRVPKWDKIERVDLEHTDIEELPAGRPRWMIPAGVATLLLIIVAVFYGMTHRTPEPGSAVRIGQSTVVPTAPSTPSGFTPRGGFLTQSAGGTLGRGFVGSPYATPADSAAAAAAAASSASLLATTPTAPVDSEAVRARRAAAREAAARRRAEQAAADSASMPPGYFNSPRRALPGADSVAIDTVRRDSVARRDSVPRRDTVARRDTLARRDSLRRDTIRPPRDTTRPPRDTTRPPE